MASGDDACDAALAAWAAACLGESDGPPRTLEDLAEGPPLLSLARRFVRGAEAALPSDAAALSRPPRDSRVEVARHINDVYRDEHGRAARIVDVRWAGRSDTRAARALLLGVLLAAFQGPQAQEAAARIGALPQGHQGALAAAMHGVLARVASDAEADDAAGAVQPLGAEAPDGVPGAGPRRPSHASGGGGSPRGGPLEERRPSGQVGGGPGGSACSALWASRRGSFAGGAQEELEELSEALEDGRSRCRSERQASLHLVREIYAAKERLHHEADACHELQDEFESLRQEARDTESSVQYLREEVHEETRAASRHARKHGLAQQKVELLQKECKACDSECCELREQLAFTESGEKAAPKLSWSIVQRTKLKSMTDHQVEMDARLAHVNFVCSEEHMNVQRLAPSLEEARERLREFDSEAAKERARLHEAEALIGSAEVQEEVHRRNMRRLAGASTDELLGELVLLRDEEQQALRQAGLEEASARALQDAVEEARAAARCAVAPDHESEPDFSDYAPYETTLGELQASLADAEAEAQALREEVREAERCLAEASRRAAGAEESLSRGGTRPLRREARALEEQIQLRVRELLHRSQLAERAATLHDREMRLASSALHRLGLRWARLRDKCADLQEAEALAEQTGADAAWLPAEPRRGRGVLAALWG